MPGGRRDPVQSAEGTAADYTTGTPWLDIDLDGNVTPDMTADIKDNYALAVNKDKISDLEIPEGYPYGGTIMDLVLQQAEDVKNMFLGDTPEEHNAKLAYDLFWLMMDWDSRNALGVAPLKEMTDKMEAISTIDELLAYHVETPIFRYCCRYACLAGGTPLHGNISEAGRQRPHHRHGR